MSLMDLYKSCALCPRECGIDRTQGVPGEGAGFCGETDQLRVAYVGPHFGEEPPITGVHGSGTVFFTGCSLRCRFCQNYQISHNGMGEMVSLETLYGKIKRMLTHEKVHNINFVTPDHFLPHAAEMVATLKKNGMMVPVVFNFSGYQSVTVLKQMEPYADIYLPDFKYSDTALAGRLSGCSDYPEKGINAISEMIRQKGFMDASAFEGAFSTEGVMVRHLILPGHMENSMNALTILFIEFGPKLPLSLMSQYHPALSQKAPELNRPTSQLEFERVYEHTKALGFEYLYVQFPRAFGEHPSFLPDFRNGQPFKQR